METHADANEPGDAVQLIDDLIASRGAAEPAGNLIQFPDGNLVGAGLVMDLPELSRPDKLRARGLNVRAIIAFEGH
jgi:adenine phosphoribosyltransferase